MPHEPFEGRNDYLARLPEPYYRGFAHVHWSMTIQNRRTGWLDVDFLHRFREILIHTLFRYALCCPIYCCMPDHLHLLWVGLALGSNQLVAAKFFRRQLNEILLPRNCELQQQPYDHVLRDEQLERSAFENAVEYIARNPERARLIPVDGFRDYPYTECLLPGYPELSLWQPDFWPRYWRVVSYLRANGLLRLAEVST